LTTEKGLRRLRFCHGVKGRSQSSIIGAERESSHTLQQMSHEIFDIQEERLKTALTCITHLRRSFKEIDLTTLPPSVASHAETALAYVAAIKPYLTAAKASITTARQCSNTIKSFITAAKTIIQDASCWISDRVWKFIFAIF
jgi:hypothetical protein